MKKTFVGILAALMLLTACGNKNTQPYADTISKYISTSDTGNEIPEKYWEVAGAMFEQARRDTDMTGDFLYKWTFADPGENVLGIGGITLSFVVDDEEHLYTLMISD